MLIKCKHLSAVCVIFCTSVSFSIDLIKVLHSSIGSHFAQFDIAEQPKVHFSAIFCLVCYNEQKNTTDKNEINRFVKHHMSTTTALNAYLRSYAAVTRRLYRQQRKHFNRRKMEMSLSVTQTSLLETIKKTFNLSHKM